MRIIFSGAKSKVRVVPESLRVADTLRLFLLPAFSDHPYRMLSAAQGRLRLLSRHLASPSRAPVAVVPPIPTLLRSLPLHRRMASTPAPTFPLSPAPKLPEGQYVRTCGMLVIGDEVLNGQPSRSNLAADDGIDTRRAHDTLTRLHWQARLVTPTQTFSQRCSSTSRST